MSRKRKFDDGEPSVNDANVSQRSEGVNKNLLKCLVGLTRHIINVHNNKYEPIVRLAGDGSSASELTEHNVTNQPHFQVDVDDSLSKNISLLKEQTAELEKIYNTPQCNRSSDSLNPTNYSAIDNLLRANVVQHLSENSANLTEQICNLISMYRSEESQENARDIRKCLSKINRKIKSIPLQSDVISETDSDVFFSSLNQSNVSHKTHEYLTAAHNLSDKLSVLIKKVSKLKKIYKKRVLKLNKSELVVKKRKLGYSSNHESMVVDDNVNNNNVNDCSTPMIVKNTNQTTNDNELTDSSIVHNANAIETLDKSILEPYNSNYVNELLESYSVIAKKAKVKRKLKEKSVLNSAIANKTKTTDNNEIQDAVIKIESDDDDSAETRKKKKRKTVHGVLGQNNEDVIVESAMKSVKKKRKSAVNSTESAQEILTEINENYSETTVAESQKKTVKKKKKSMEENAHEILIQNAENTQNNLIKNNENSIETVPKENPKKPAKKKRKSVENSNENVQETLTKHNENNTETVSEETPKKTSKKKRKSVENSNENVQETLTKHNENNTETVSEETPKKPAKKKRKSVENSNENVQETLTKHNENNTETVSEETPKKTAKKKRKSVENSTENAQEMLVVNNEISLNVNSEKSHGKTSKERKNHSAVTENILHDILHHICAHVVHENETESTVERNNESEEKSAMKKRRKHDRNKENVIVFEDNTKNVTKVKRKEKLMTEILNDSNEHEMPEIGIRSTENFGNDVPEIPVDKKKRKSAKKKRKSAKFIVESSEESESVVVNNGVLLRQKEKQNENDTTNLLGRKKKNKNENLPENDENNCELNNEHFLKKSHKNKIKPREIVDENTIETMENSKRKVKKHQNREENSAREILAENREIDCKGKDKKRRKSGECRNGNCSENTDILLEITGNLHNEISSEKMRETMGNIKIEPWENVSVEMGNNDVTNTDITSNDIVSKRRSFSENVKNVLDNDQLSGKLQETRKSSSLLEPNTEQPDDIFSSVFKIEPFDDDDDDGAEGLQRDLNLNAMSLNSCLQDEDLDEREQYLYLRERVESAKEKMELSEATKDRLRSLCVLLDFDVPAAHKIENRLCAGPSPEQARQMAALGVKPGRLAKDEDEIIRRNFASFCKVHDLPNDPAPFLTLQHAGEKIISYEDRRKFVQYLGKDLGHRALHSIYRRFKTLFKVTKNGRFSEDEDMLLLSYVKFSGNGAKFADLMPLLNRSRTAIEARYRVLNKALSRVSWDLSRKAELLKHMKQVLEVANVTDLQHADVTHAHLAEVARRMNLPVVKIRHQWCTKLYTQLFAAEPLYLDQMKVDLVNRLYELKLDDWRKVNWCEVAKTFPGVSPVSLRVLMKTLFRHNCPKKLQADLGAIINHCRTIVIPELKSRADFNQKYINRLKVNQDGGLREYI